MSPVLKKLTNWETRTGKTSHCMNCHLNLKSKAWGIILKSELASLVALPGRRCCDSKITTYCRYYSDIINLGYSFGGSYLLHALRNNLCNTVGMCGLQLEFTHIQWRGSIVDATLACMLYCEHRNIYTLHNCGLKGLSLLTKIRKFAELPTRLGVTTHDSAWCYGRIQWHVPSTIRVNSIV